MNNITRKLTHTKVITRCYNKDKDKLENVTVNLVGDSNSETWTLRRVKEKLKSHPNLSYLSIVEKTTESKTYELPVDVFIKTAEEYMNQQENEKESEEK